MTTADAPRARAGGRAAAAKAALAVALLALVLAATLPSGAEASRKKKISKGACASLERSCGFITDGGGGGSGDISAGFFEARFTLTAADDGSVSCDPDTDCAYNPDSGVLSLQTFCPSSDYTAIQSTCAPLEQDPNDGTEVLNPRVVVSQNLYYEAVYCTVPQPVLPDPGTSSSWIISVYCVKGIPNDAPLDGGKVAVAAKRKVGARKAASG